MNTHSILKQDIAKDIEPNKTEVAFKTNKILSRILKKLEEGSLESRIGWTKLMDWSEATAILSGILPSNYLVQSAKDLTLVDPFRGIKQAFPATYNSKIDSIVKAVEAMHSVSGKRYCSDHSELLEIFEDCKLVDPEEVKSLSLELIKSDLP